MKQKINEREKHPSRMKKDYLKVSKITFSILISAEFCHQIIPQRLEFGSDDSSDLNTSKQNTRL